MSDRLIIDVREPDEYRSHHIPNSINIPLTQLANLHHQREILAGKPLYLMCKSGRRAGMAKPHFDAQNLSCEIYAGGIDQWKTEGKPLTIQSRSTISIFRQVQIIIGFLVAGFSLLGVMVNPGFVWVAAVLGTALGIAGIFGFCLLAELLNKMPWNRIPS